MSGRRDRGIILVAVLFAVAIMSVMVVAVTALTRAGVAGQGLEQRRLATQLALRSGLESAKALIAATAPAERVFFDGAMVGIELGGGLLAEVSIRDAAGLPDLNRTDLQLLESLLRSELGAADATELFNLIAGLRAEALKDMTQQVPAPAQPSAQGASGQEKAREVPPAPVVFHAIEQLKALAEPRLAARLSDRLTVFNPSGMINPLAAPDEVLLAVPGFGNGDLAAVNATGKERTQKPAQALAQLLDRQKAFLAIKDATVFVIGIRLARGPGIIAMSTASAVVQTSDQGPLPFRTLAVSGL